MFHSVKPSVLVLKWWPWNPGFTSNAKNRCYPKLLPDHRNPYKISTKPAKLTAYESEGQGFESLRVYSSSE